jgi:tetratricopeptide (TPR) repeat protein
MCMASGQQRSDMDAESEVWQAISAFEAILEVMPDDRSSLETLSHAYEQIGDRVKALDYLLRLAEVVLAENDPEAAAHVVERLQEYAEAGDQVREMIQRMQAQELGEAGDGHADAPPAASSEPTMFRVTDELAFAWKLFEAGEISQEDYSVVAQDLAELSIDPNLSTASVLHVLETRAFSGLERVMGYASRDTKTPILSLISYEMVRDVTGLLPLDFMIRHGAVIFGQMLEELLVVVMNPYNQALRKEIATKTGKLCHFFMTQPRDFDDWMRALKAPA